MLETSERSVYGRYARELDDASNQSALTPPAAFALNYAFTLDYTYSLYSFSSIDSGMNNTIIVPASIFTNSYFYQHEIVEGNGKTTWPTLNFYSDDSSASTTSAHVSGMITGNITGDEFLSLLDELSKNTTGAKAYNYSLEDPTELNLPVDAVKLIPFSGYAYSLVLDKYLKLENSPMGDIPGITDKTGKGEHNTICDFWGWLGNAVSGAVNAIISVGTAVWNALTELGNIICSAITAVVTTITQFIDQLTDALVNFGKALVGAFKDVIQVVAEAVQKVVEVLNAIVDWVRGFIEDALNSLISPVKSAIDSFVSSFNQIISKINDGSATLDEIIYDLVGLLIGHSPPHQLMIYLMALGLGILALEVGLLVVTTVLGGGVVLNLLSEVVFTNLVNQMITGVLTVGAGLTIATLLPMILDTADPAWDENTGLGLSMISVITSVGIGIYSVVNKMNRYLWDAVGLVLCLAGLILTLSGAASTFLGAVTAALISGIGIMIALIGPDIPGIVGKLDEALGITCFAFASYNVAEVATGG